jgi:hypothetical protein
MHSSWVFIAFFCPAVPQYLLWYFLGVLVYCLAFIGTCSCLSWFSCLFLNLVLTISFRRYMLILTIILAYLNTDESLFHDIPAIHNFTGSRITCLVQKSPLLRAGIGCFGVKTDTGRPEYIDQVGCPFLVWLCWKGSGQFSELRPERCLIRSDWSICSRGGNFFQSP